MSKSYINCKVIENVILLSMNNVLCIKCISSLVDHSYNFILKNILLFKGMRTVIIT